MPLYIEVMVLVTIEVRVMPERGADVIGLEMVPIADDTAEDVTAEALVEVATTAEEAATETADEPETTAAEDATAAQILVAAGMTWLTALSEPQL